MKYSDLKFTWFSEISAKMGYGLQSRRMLKPLIEGGADIKLIPDEDYLPAHMKIDDPFWREQIELSKTKPDNTIRIHYCLPPRGKPDPNAINIMYCMWETDQYPRQWAQIVNKNFQIFFAGCNSLVDSAKKAGISTPIIPINATLDIKDWDPVGPKLNLNEVPNEYVKFLFIGNFIPRKNLEDLLLGFNVAFEGVQDVALIIKTWSQNNDAGGKKHIADAIRHLNNKATGLSHKPKVTLITDILEEDQIKALIRTSDSYVSVSKGEGFDLPMMQAMALEKLIVTNRFLAHADYLSDQNSINVKHSLTPCVDAHAPLYDSYQLWSRVDMEDYINSLRKAYTIIKEGKQASYGVAARETIVNNFSEEINTEKIANIIRSIKYEKKENIKDTIKKLV